MDYRKLSNEGLENIEHNQEVHELYLDFLTYLHDVVSVAPPALEPPHFARSTSERRIERIIADLRSDGDLGLIARENFEKAATLASNPGGKDLERFVLAVLSEYSSLRQLHAPDLLHPVCA